MADPPAQDIEAVGTRSVAAGQIGVAATGDQATIDARTTTLTPGAIPEPAGVTAPPGTHNLPRRPVRVFVGRDDALGRLRGVLDEGAKAVVTQAVYGLGGVGKSELALHHAHACQTDYTLMWWITAEDQAQVQAGLAALAARLCPPMAMAGTTAEAAGWAVAWLQAHDRWLLILDNVNEPQDVEPLLGQLTSGHILLTTRRDTEWEQVADPIRLDVLDPGPAADLLTTRAGHQDADSHAAATTIAAELGYLPLALDQAAAYITQTRITPPVYLQRLRQQPADMYAAGGGQAQRTVSRVWDITIEAIRPRHTAAIKLLHILACFAPDNLPRLVLGNGDNGGQLAVDEALSVLASYSMITLTTDTVSMHRLVQAVIVARQLSEPEGLAFGDQPSEITALEWLNDALPEDPERNMTGWPLLRALISHAEHLGDRFSPGDRPELLALAQNQVALFRQSQGEYQQALGLRKSALEIYEAALGPNHPNTATALNNLASAYRALGQADKALPLQQRALTISETALGPDHPDTGIRLGNLASAYRALGQADKALPLEQRALTIIEAALGPDHPHTATALGNLAFTYNDLGQADKALPLEQRALTITETVLGPDHPDTGMRLGNLAHTYLDLRQAKKALPLQRRALAITEATLGPNHPHTATALSNLAHTYLDLRQAKKALPLVQRSLAITETALGPNHPDTGIQLNNLAFTYNGLGQAKKALPLLQRSLAITEAVLGPDHPRTVMTLENLADTYRNLRQADKALPLEQRALSIKAARRDGSRASEWGP